MSAFLRLFQTDPGPRLEGGKVVLRLPRLSDYKAWSALRTQSAAFLEPWEPTWPKDDLTRAAFRNRLGAYARELETGEAFPFFLFRRDDATLIGGVRLFHIRRGVAQSAVLGYWIGQPYARRGYMLDGVRAAVDFAFGEMGLHRLEAACMPENAASASVLLKSGFLEEGYAPAYLKINGEWRDHRLFGMVAPPPAV
ncbi:GNAT family N-acetyltransferase [Caulobacter sp. DWR2-3-1b2]|uniref:GNAT family N-acetyltransferase n=1 Tax=Caulobacter sp. DWR2-3-1b2 TaxID=2804642 RepID=UPI003CF7AA4F